MPNNFCMGIYLHPYNAIVLDEASGFCCLYIVYCCSHSLWGFCIWSLFCNTILSVLSSFAIILMIKEERACCFTFVLLMSCDCWCSVTLPSYALYDVVYPGHACFLYGG